MSDSVFSATADNLSFKLIYDQYCSSPRKDDDGIITHILVEPNSRSGSIDNFNDSVDLLNSIARLLLVENYQDMNCFELINAISLCDTTKKHIYKEPLYKYEHSGIVYSTSPFSCPWDSGQVGYIFTTAKDFERVGLDWSIDTASKNINCELEVYNSYIAGQCYGFTIESSYTCGTCTTTHHDEIDAVWGYIGEQNEIIKMIAHDYLDSYPNLKKKVLEQVE